MIIRILDVETTGLDPAIDRIVEIATVDLLISDEGAFFAASLSPRGTEITRGRIWSSLINSGVPIKPDASAVHQIVDEMLTDAPQIRDVVDTLMDGPPDHFAAHNSRFDQQFINPSASIQWIDTYRGALWWWPDAPSHSNQALRYWKKIKLADDAGAPHRARGDAYVTAAILRRMILEGAKVEDLITVSSQPALLTKFRFGKHSNKPIADIDAYYLEWLLNQADMDEDVKHTAFTELSRRRTQS